MKYKKFLPFFPIFLLSLLFGQFSIAQQVIPLYPDKIPNSRNATNEEQRDNNNAVIILSKISVPTMAIYLPKKEIANGTAIIIFPGGGYWTNAIGYEGTEVAEQFQAMGYAAFVVKYRIPSTRTMFTPYIGPLQDAQQAILTVRSKAKEWDIDPKSVGVMGFSAGGHLASTLATHYKESKVDNPEKLSLRPDFQLLIYPVISGDTTIAHRGSFEQLFGKNSDPATWLIFSNERQVTTETPPAFLVHATDDDLVPVANSIRFYEALTSKKVPAEMHLYQKGGHGFGMNNPTTKEKWMSLAFDWLRANGWRGKNK